MPKPSTLKARIRGTVELLALRGIPEIRQGADLPSLCVEAADKQRLRWQAGDVLVLAQKTVSKAEGATIDLSTVWPSPKARELAAKLGKDPRFLEIVLQ